MDDAANAAVPELAVQPLHERRRSTARLDHRDPVGDDDVHELLRKFGLAALLAHDRQVHTKRTAALDHGTAARDLLVLLALPSAMDVIVTGLATISLAFVQPALSGILRASSRLISLAIATRVFQGKKQQWSQVSDRNAHHSHRLVTAVGLGIP